MVMRREVGWCVGTGFRLFGQRRRRLSKWLRPGVILPVVFHRPKPEEVREVLDFLVTAGGADRLEITFDDGWREFAATLPVLEEFQLPVTLFIAPGETERGTVWSNAAMGRVPEAEWHGWYRLAAAERAEHLAAHGLDRLPRELLTPGEVARLAAHPLVEIGNHTYSHLSAPHRPAAEVLAEVDAAQRRLEEWCGVKPTKVAYPFGRGTRELDGELRHRGLTPYYTRQGLVTDFTRGTARNTFYEGMTFTENLGRLLMAWPRVGETR